MVVHTLWFWRKNEKCPELLVAWDEYSVEANTEGWEAACAEGLEDVRSDMTPELGYRYIDISVDGEVIEQLFFTEEINGAPTRAAGS